MKVYHRTISISSILIALFVLSGCSQSEKEIFEYKINWHYSDLRIVDPVDSKIPEMDVIAIYMRDEGELLKLRLDLLEMNTESIGDIYIGIDYEPGGNAFYSFENNVTIPSEIEWEIVLEIPSNGNINGYDSDGQLITGIETRIFRDTSLDMIDISTSKLRLGQSGPPLEVEVLIRDPLSNVVVDRVAPVNSKAIPPEPAEVALVFWNFIQAYTPAQSLRMWDGAHTGPMSSRHGLRHLLQAVERSGVSMYVYGLESPITKTSLNYLGVYQDFMELVSGGDLKLVDGFGQFLCLSGILVGEKVINGYAKLNDQQIPSVVPLEIRQELVNSAISGKGLIFGGDFTNSLWGNPTAVSIILDYLQSHPWIIIESFPKVIKELSYINCNKNQRLIPTSISPRIHDNFTLQYLSTPNNILRELAFQTYSTIISPANQEARSIAGNYFWQLGHILSAAMWFENPTILSSCAVDLDWDGQDECILSTENIFLTFELTGGFLAFSFFKDEQGVHQITAPMSEVIIGLGDPMTYDPEKGVFADPSLIPGALVNIDENEELYSFNNGSDFVELFNENSGVQKTFQITNDSIHIGWATDQAISYFIPLSLDPWVRFEADWSERYYFQDVNNHLIWGIDNDDNDIAVQINSSTPIRFDTFINSKELIKQAEDPNFDYPPGYYLPYPFAQIEILPAEDVNIELRILNKLH